MQKLGFPAAADLSKTAVLDTAPNSVPPMIADSSPNSRSFYGRTVSITDADRRLRLPPCDPRVLLTSRTRRLSICEDISAASYTTMVGELFQDGPPGRMQKIGSPAAADVSKTDVLDIAPN